MIDIALHDAIRRAPPCARILVAFAGDRSYLVPARAPDHIHDLGELVGVHADRCGMQAPYHPQRKGGATDH